MEERILQVRRKLLSEINDQELKKLGLILEQIAHNALDSLGE